MLGAWHARIVTRRLHSKAVLCAGPLKIPVLFNCEGNHAICSRRAKAGGTFAAPSFFSTTIHLSQPHLLSLTSIILNFSMRFFDITMLPALLGLALVSAQAPTVSLFAGPEFPQPMTDINAFFQGP